MGTLYHSILAFNRKYLQNGIFPIFLHNRTILFSILIFIFMIGGYNMVKNALLSFKNNIGKTVLSLFVAIILVNLLICALVIRQTSNSSVKQIYANSNNEVTLTPNSDNQTTNQITVDMANQLCNFQYVKNYNYNIAIKSSSSQINPIRMDINNQNHSYDQASFIINANSSMTNLNDFTNNINELIEGRLLTKDDAGTNNCVIETTLANNNNLNLNDTFTIYSADNQSASVELKVVGIYKIKNYRTLNQTKQSDLLNTIYTDLSIGQKLTNDNQNLTVAIYYLDDLKNIDKFINLANRQSNINFENYSLETDLLVYQRDIINFQKNETNAILAIIIITIIGTIILGTILLSLLKKHYNEIEIFLSLGQSKIKIILQQFINIVIVAVVALIICLSTGKILNKTIINSLNTTTNSEQITIVMPNIVNENDGNNIEVNGKSAIVTSSLLNTNDINFSGTLDINSIAILVGATGIICLLSIVIAAIYIGKISPSDILIKRER